MKFHHKVNLDTRIYVIIERNTIEIKRRNKMKIFPNIKGTIDNYDIIVIGHLRWNRYFHESPDAPPRGDPSTCTSTLIQGKDASGQKYVLLVDPTLRIKPQDYYFDINRRTGLHPEDITHCFVTHDHTDHQAGLNYFPNARWLAAPGVAEILKTSTYIDGSRVEVVEGEFLPGVYAYPIPGHTLSLHGVAFSFYNKKIIVAGDGVMTKYHFYYNTTEFEKDAELAADSIRNLKENFDIIIPGHDNAIVYR